MARALENNVDIAVEKLNPEMSQETLRLAQGVYEPLAFSTVTQNSRTDPARNVFAGGAKVNTDTTTYDFGASQLLPTGGNLRLDFDNNRQNSDSSISTFNPNFGSSLLLQFQQPLLRNFSIDTNRYQIQVARRNFDISETQFKQTVVNTTASVKNLYYDLIYAADNLEAQRKSLSLATKLVEENRIKVRVGTMAPLDVVAAEAEQASREEAVILAENALLEAEDALKSAIFPKNDPATWALRIVPTERPTAEPVQVDVEAATRIALERRTDLRATRLSLENTDSALRLARNQRLPQLDLVASYGSNGIGGTQILRNDPLGPVTGTVPGGFGDALSDVFGRDFPTWTLGVNVAYPFLNRQNEAAAARAELAREQGQASLRRAELQVASEVRTAGRAVETNYKRVDSTRAARVLAGAAAGRRGEEVRGRPVHQLPGHAGPARPGGGPGGRAARGGRLPQEHRQLRARAGSRRRRVLRVQRGRHHGPQHGHLVQPRHSDAVSVPKDPHRSPLVTTFHGTSSRHAAALTGLNW